MKQLLMALSHQNVMILVTQLDSMLASSVLHHARLGMQHSRHLFSTAWRECRKKSARGTCCACGSRRSRGGHCQSSLQTDTTLLRLATEVAFTARMKVRMSHWTHFSDTSVRAVTLIDVCRTLFMSLLRDLTHWYIEHTLFRVRAGWNKVFAVWKYTKALFADFVSVSDCHAFEIE